MLFSPKNNPDHGKPRTISEQLLGRKIQIHPSIPWLIFSILFFQLLLLLFFRPPHLFHFAHTTTTATETASLSLPTSDESSSETFAPPQKSSPTTAAATETASLSLPTSDESSSETFTPPPPPERSPSSPVNTTAAGTESATLSLPETVPPPQPPAKSASSSVNAVCPYGKVYVYDLPPIFNSDLVKKCDELNPWHSSCDALSNGGFGKLIESSNNPVPERLRHAWHSTDQFALELIHHNRMLNYSCRSSEPESATAFYIPFYAGLAVGKYLWYNYTARDRDLHCEMMLNWVTNQSSWSRSNGWDHFLSMGRITWDFRRKEGYPWGSFCIMMPGMRNVTRLLIERHPWDSLDVGVPYPTGFHPSSVADVTSWQDFVRTRRREVLYSFAGGTRGRFKNDFRGLLLKQCYNNSDVCRVVDCSGERCAGGTTTILETFLDSDFCLQPRGDSFTRRSTFDCMVAGSIPVFFWWRTAYLQYAWFLPEEPESYSVFIHRKSVQNGTVSIRAVLEGISKGKIAAMREKVIEYIPRLVYSKTNGGLDGVKDAFDLAVEGVLKRVTNSAGNFSIKSHW